MRRLALLSVFALALLLCLGPPAAAGESVRGDVCSFRLPPGFQKAPLPGMGSGEDSAGQMRLFEDMMGDFADADIHVYVRIYDGKSDAVLTVTGIRPKGRLKRQMGEMEKGLDAMEAQLRERMAHAPAEAEDFSVRRIRIGSGHEALEIQATTFDEELQGLATTRTVIVVERGAVLYAMFGGRAENATIDDATWRGFVTSLHLESRSSAVRLAYRYGPFVLGGLLLLLIFNLVRRRGRQQRVVTRWPTSETSSTTAAPGGSGLSRAADGLPTYAEGQPARGAGPASAPISPPRIPAASSSPPDPSLLGASESGTPPPGGRRIPRATPPAIPGMPTGDAQAALGVLSPGGNDDPPAPPASPGATPAPPPSPASASTGGLLAGSGSPSVPSLTEAPPPLPPAPPSMPAPMPGVVASRAPGTSSALHRPTPPQVPAPPPLPQGQARSPAPAPDLPTNVARRDPAHISTAPGLGALDGIDGLEPSSRDEPPPPGGLKIQRNSDFSGQ